MLANDRQPWQFLETWNSVVFLVAGVLMLVGSGDLVLGLVADIQMSHQVQFLAFFSVLVSYIGMLGLYPRIAGSSAWLARAGLLLPLLPVLVIIVDVSALLLGAAPPFGELLGGEAVFLSIFVGIGTGIASFAIVGIRAGTPSRAVGGALLLYAAAWGLFFGVAVASGPLSDSITLIGNLMMAAGMLATGYLLRAGDGGSATAEQGADSAV